MNAPTLLIGLGGTGCKIIERVSKMVTGEQRNNIAFAVFDTDINDLRGIQERNPFIKTIQTSTKQTVGEYPSLGNCICLQKEETNRWNNAVRLRSIPQKSS